MKQAAVCVIWLVCGALAALAIWHDRSFWLIFWILVLACCGTAAMQEGSVITVNEHGARSNDDA